MNVSLPDQMKSWVEDQTRDGRYRNVSDYVRDLIREDQDRKIPSQRYRKQSTRVWPAAPLTLLTWRLGSTARNSVTLNYYPLGSAGRFGVDLGSYACKLG